MALDLLRELLQHINLSLSSLALLKSLHDLLCPLATLSAWRTLSTGFVSVEVTQS